jgi:hypothetical protein
VNRFRRSADNLANFGNAKALHHPEQQAGDILRRKARERGAHCFALGKGILKRGSDSKRLRGLFLLKLQRFPTDNSPPSQRRNAAMIRRSKEPAPRRLWRVSSAKGRGATARSQPGVVKHILCQVERLLIVGNQAAQEAN